MAIFLTGSTGYVGAHVAALLLEDHNDRLNLLIRAKDKRKAAMRLRHTIQLHLDFQTIFKHLNSSIFLFCDDLTDSRFSMSQSEYQQLRRTTDSVIHCAASLNRKSEKSCLNVNLR